LAAQKFHMQVAGQILPEISMFSSFWSLW